MLFGQLQFRTKIGDFVGLRFEVVEIEIPEHEVEHRDAGTDVFEFVLAAVAEILSANLAVNPPREQMVSGAALGETIGTCVLGGLKFGPEERGSFAPARAGKAQELTGDEVSRMSGDEIQKTRFVFGVPESFERVDLCSREIHRERIFAVISLSSRTRRSREVSSRRAYREKPAFAFSPKARGL